MSQVQHRRPCALRKLTLAIALALPSIATSLPSSAADTSKAVTLENAKQNFNIPAQPLANALNAFIATSDWQVGFPAGLAKDVRANAVSGSYTPQQALEKLLQGTGLVYRVTGGNSVTLEKTVEQSPQTKETTLAPVTVAGAVVYDSTDPYNKDYSLPNAFTGTKTDTPLFDTPMSVQVVPKAVIADQQAIGLEDALKNVSGVAKGWGFGNDKNENLYIRGFDNGSSIYRDGVLTPNTPISLANAERVEVLKGPSAMLYGRAQPGGLVNIVTKRPKTEAYYSLQQQFGSFDTYRTLLDATNKITEDGALAYRVNYEHLDSATFRDNHPITRDFVAPSLTWKITDKTQLDLDFMYQNIKDVGDSGIPYNLQKSGAIPGKIPINFSGNEPTDFADKEAYTGGVTLTHEFNQDWKLRAKYSTHNQTYLTAQTPSNENVDLLGNLARGFIKTSDDFQNQYGTVDITGHFATGPLQHNVLIGADYYHSKNRNLYSAYQSAPTINVFNPQYGFNDFANIPLGGQNDNTNEWYGIYVQDQLSLWNQWHLLMGGRFDNAMTSSYDDKGVLTNHTDDDNFSPRIGLLYQPITWLGAYVNYVNGFNAFNSGTPLTGSSFEPERSKEMEFGLKGEWLDGKLRSNLAFFELTKTNVKSQLPAPFSSFYATTGAQRSRGIEYDLQGQVTDYLNVIGTYTYTEAVVTSGNDSPFSGVGKAGDRFANIPRNAASLWSTLDFSEFGAQGFSAGAGVYLVGRRMGNVNNSFEVPGYARVDTMLKYQHPVGPSKLTLQFNIENLLDKEYISSSNGYGDFIYQTLPGAPRTFLGSVKVEF
ncbi:MAG: TonB-dependent receptor [Methylococcaceae bacterium]|nr:TonB-dependent receptor [Methylococcaceae bacterium]MDP3904934.1 TonB-dependent receptor [Methylococcaceae bacterium]